MACLAKDVRFKVQEDAVICVQQLNVSLDGLRHQRISETVCNAEAIRLVFDSFGKGRKVVLGVGFWMCFAESHLRRDSARAPTAGA